MDYARPMPKLPAYTMIAALVLCVSEAAAGDGTDWSWNAPSVAGMTLIGTIPESLSRAYVEVMVNCAAGAIVAVDDAKGKTAPTYYPIAGNSGQGGSWSSRHHTGRVRIFSVSPTCQIAGREW